MTRPIALAALAASLAAAPALAQEEGDVAKGEQVFKKCKACHQVADGDEVIYKGGRTGPNLFNIIGRTAGSLEDYKYGASIVQAGEIGLVWDDENLVAYLTDPRGYLRSFLDDKRAKSKMTYKLKRDHADVIAYLRSVSPDAPPFGEAPTEAEETDAEKQPTEG